MCHGVPMNRAPLLGSAGLFVFALTLVFVVMAALGPRPVSAANCHFALGFATLHDLIPTTVGDCLVDEHHNPVNGDGLQETTGPTGAGGLLVWRKADNWTAFTDGSRTWINGPFGLENRSNGARFLWEDGGVDTTWVRESDAERATCAGVPNDAMGPLAASCWAIGERQKLQVLIDQSVSGSPSATPVPLVSSVPPPVAQPVVVLSPQPQNTFATIDGQAVVVAADGQYLGLVSSNQFASDSICNSFGRYGSKFSSTSIRDDFGTYGSEFAPLSAYNNFASRPPAIIANRHIVGHLTKNTMLFDAVDPDLLFSSLGC
jgi:hypothetical protein